METPQLKFYFDTSDGNILSNIRWIDKRGAVTWPYLKIVKSRKVFSIAVAFIWIGKAKKLCLCNADGGEHSTEGLFAY